MIDRVYGKDFPTLCFALVEASELEIGIYCLKCYKKSNWIYMIKNIFNIKLTNKNIRNILQI